MKRSKNHTRSVRYEMAVHNLLKMRPFNPSTSSGRTGWASIVDWAEEELGDRMPAGAHPPQIL
jgi:hypothetical protein